MQEENHRSVWSSLQDSTRLLLSSDFFMDVSWSSDRCSWSILMPLHLFWCNWVTAKSLSLLSDFISAYLSLLWHILLCSQCTVLLHTCTASPSLAQVLCVLLFLSAPSLLHCFSYSLTSPVFLRLTPAAPPHLISLACVKVSHLLLPVILSKMSSTDTPAFPLLLLPQPSLI